MDYSFFYIMLTLIMSAFLIYKISYYITKDAEISSLSSGMLSMIVVIMTLTYILK